MPGQSPPTLPGPLPADSPSAGATDAMTYAGIRRIARRALGPQAHRHTLPPTAVANEVFLRLTASGVDRQDHASLLAMAATAVRSVLIDHARRRNRRKRGGDLTRVDLPADLIPAPEAPVDMVDLDEALAALAAHDPRAASVVELRFFGGLGIDQCARCLDVSPATVERDWRFARAWLHRVLACSEAAHDPHAPRTRPEA